MSPLQVKKFVEHAVLLLAPGEWKMHQGSWLDKQKQHTSHMWKKRKKKKRDYWKTYREPLEQWFFLYVMELGMRQKERERSRFLMDEEKTMEDKKEKKKGTRQLSPIVGFIF